MVCTRPAAAVSLAVHSLPARLEEDPAGQVYGGYAGHEKLANRRKGLCATPIERVTHLHPKEKRA